nr:MAG TPA: hypothetical protein [Caudoviricetes sp.]
MCYFRLNYNLSAQLVCYFSPSILICLTSFTYSNVQPQQKDRLW